MGSNDATINGGLRLRQRKIVSKTTRKQFKHLSAMVSQTTAGGASVSHFHALGMGEEGW